jgi:hypothetical protein
VDLNRFWVLPHRKGIQAQHDVTATEIKSALRSIDDKKARGPDGYNTIFFKRSWSVMGKQVTDACLEFFSMGKLLKQLNHIIIALIPKSANVN